MWKENFWKVAKEWLGQLDKYQWVENHLLYFSIVFGGLAIVILMLIITYKLQKDIDKMDLESRRRKVKMMKDTSKKVDKEREARRRPKF